MRKIYLLILLMSCIFVVHAGNPESKQKNKTGWAKNKSLKNEKKERSAELRDEPYHDDGYPAFPLELEKIEYYNGGSGLASTRKFTTNVVARTIQELYYHNYPDGEELLSSQAIYGYDTSNRILSVVKSSNENGAGKLQEREKRQYTYDGQGNLASFIHHDYNEWGDLWIGWKQVYEYDSKGNQILEAYYGWDEDSNNWQGSSKYVYEYNSKGNQTLEVYYQWDKSANDWVGTEKSETTYGENGIATKYVYFAWSGSLSKWIETGKEEVLTFDNNGYPATYREVDGDHVIVTGTAVFDAKGRLLSDNNVEYDSETGEIIGINIDENTYDDRDNIISEMYKYSEDGGITYKGSKYVYEYDSKNNLILDEHYSWSSSSNNWLNNSKKISEYNNNNKKTFEEYLYWDEDVNEWRKNSKNTWGYDKQGRLVLRETYYADDQTNEYYKPSYDVYTYKLGSSINNQTKDNSKAYVHKGILYVENNVAETISVYSLDGQLLYSVVKTEANLQSDISNLSTDILVVKGSSGWSRKVANK